MENKLLPAHLQTVIGTENIDFSVFSKRNQPKRNSITTIGFGIFWITGIGIVDYIVFSPLFQYGATEVYGNDANASVSWYNFEHINLVNIVLFVFTLIGLSILAWGIYSLFKKGSYFVATANTLIRYQDGEINKYAWELFTGTMEINLNSKDISLQLRSNYEEILAIAASFPILFIFLAYPTF